VAKSPQSPEKEKEADDVVSIKQPKALLGIPRSFRPRALLILALVGALLLLFSIVTAAGAGDVTDTWKKRIQVEPSGVTGPVPVVIFVHGCSGLGTLGTLHPDTQHWVQTVTGAGYRFVAPDSWARGTWSRPNSCPTPLNEPQPTGETRLKVRLMRIEEMAYSVARLHEDATVDQARIVLFGHSEGGLAIATSAPPAGIGGLIISGWTCHSLVALGRGIATPPSIPLLALGFEQDTTVGITQGRCSEFFPGRDGAKELILNGAGYQAGGSAEARQAVVNFLGGLR
jgi:poly(3-hydroxybutyrate) depolymerase